MKKKILISHLNLFLFLIFLFGSVSLASSDQIFASSNGFLTEAEARYIRQRQLLYYRDEYGDRGENVSVDPSLVFENPRIRTAYIALQAWKQAILSDPMNLTRNWVGSNVCNYTGVYCSPALDNPTIRTVAGIDLNHGDIAGYLPEELGLLVDLALFHINSNRFCGTVPHKFDRLKLLFELDLSNNRFAGRFPEVVLRLPALKFLDIRYNEFEGTVPKELFDKDLDAIFINHNRFAFDLPAKLPQLIHLLRPRTGSGGQHIHGINCDSWRLAVETNNIRDWKTVPQSCENYVGHYMLGHLYREDCKVVADEAVKYAESLKLAGNGNEVWIFDVDETTLSNIPYYAIHGFGAVPFNATLFNAWVMIGKALPLPESLRLYKKLLSIGLKIVFLTGRGESQRQTTAANLKKAGYHTWEKLVLKGKIDSGKTAVAYKSGQRTKLTQAGYTIVGNMGDQWSDILGPTAGGRTFKVPDPMYYIS